MGLIGDKDQPSGGSLDEDPAGGHPKDDSLSHLLNGFESNAPHTGGCELRVLVNLLIVG